MPGTDGGYALDVLTAVLALVASAQVQTIPDVAFQAADGSRLLMDVYRPSGSRKAPFAIFTHGGSWIAGDRKHPAPWCELLARNGIAAFSIEYRLGPAHRWPAMLEDQKQALEFIRRRADSFGVNPERFAFIGDSAGGHIALMAGFTSQPRPLAVLNVHGITDVEKDLPGWLDGILREKVAPLDTELSLMSPVSLVSESSPPVFTLHGLEDDVVPVMQAYRLLRVLSRHKVPSETALVPGMRHVVIFDDPEQAKAISRGIAFLKERLKPRSKPSASVSASDTASRSGAN